MIVHKGFPPVYNSDSRILILGSFPSVISRSNNFYYANPKNRFWRILSEIYKVDIGNTAEEKKLFLLEKHIALWDIVGSCNINGSNDNDIKNYEIVRLEEVLNRAKILKILCNGRKSYEITSKYYNYLDIPIVYLPSTSPANTQFDKDGWFRELKN